MAGSMDKVFTETLFPDVVSRRVVNLKAVELLARGYGSLYSFNRTIARIPHDREYIAHFRSGDAAHARPGDVVIDGARLIQLRPHVEQNEIADPDRGVHLCG